MPIILGVALILITVIIINYAQQLVRKQYGRSVSALASEMGLAFSAEQRPANPGEPGDFILFAQGIPHSRQNVIEGIYMGIDLAVYNYTFNKNWGKMQELFTQTVIQIRSVTNSVPQFNLFPREYIDAVINNLPVQESKDKLLETAGIRLPNHPEFRSKYKLMGPDIKRLQEMFDNDKVIDALEELDRTPYQGLICMEGAGQNIFIFPLHQQLQVKHIRGFIDRVTNLMQKLESTMNHSN